MCILNVLSLFLLNFHIHPKNFAFCDHWIFSIYVETKINFLPNLHKGVDFLTRDDNCKIH